MGGMMKRRTRNYIRMILLCAGLLGSVQSVRAAAEPQEACTDVETTAAAKPEADGNTCFLEQPAQAGESLTKQDADEGFPLVEEDVLSIRAVKKKLAAPEELKSGSKTWHSVRLYWKAVSGAKRYQIEVSTDGVDYTVFATTKKTKYCCKNLLTGQNYYFRVCGMRTKKSVGTPSAEVMVKPFLRKSAFLSASGVDNKAFSLEWKTIAGAEGYELYRRLAGEMEWVLLADGDGTAYQDAEVEAGKAYQYRVRAYRTVNEKRVFGKYSDQTEQKISLPATKLESCQVVDLSHIRLAWSALQDMDGYYIYRALKEDGEYSKVGELSSAKKTSFEDSSVVPGNTYFYYVAAYKKEGQEVLEGLGSNILKAAVTLASPQSGTAANTKFRSLSISWKKVEEATGYQIYRSRNKKGEYKLLAEVAASAVGYEDRMVSPGVAYFYKIKAVYVNGSETGLSEPTEVMSARVEPAAPIGLKIRQTGGKQLEISWEPSVGAESYQIFRMEAGSGKYRKLAEGFANPGYTDVDIVDGKTYYYKVAAVHGVQGSECSSVYSYTVGGVSLSSRTLKVCAGAAKKLQVETFCEGDVEWTSSNPKVASVDKDGNVTGIAYGTATITASVSGKNASASVSVTAGKKNGMDVSVWQKNVDWMKVKASGIDFAILRISNHYLQDYTFETKYANAAKAGIPVGVYCYSKAKTADEAKLEAQTILRILDGRKLDYPIAMDLEDASQKKLSKDTINQMIQAYKQTIEAAGYQFVLYSYVSFLNSSVDTARLAGIDLWIARYRSMSLGTGYTGAGNIKYWQYNSGQYAGTDYHVDGVVKDDGSLANVDVNLEY